MSRIGGQGSHWSECWRQHIDCAEIKIEKLQADLDTCTKERDAALERERVMEVAADLNNEREIAALDQRDTLAQRVKELEAGIETVRD